MKFFNYLNENRSEIIKVEKAYELVAKYCQKALNSTPIYRGKEDNEEAYIIDPKNFTRESAYANTNIYTLLIDNLISWKDYPKRSKSIICTTDFDYAENYGKIYRVFPYDGAKIGVCPEKDIWFSFDKVKEHFDNLDIFADSILKMFNLFINIQVINSFAELKELSMRLDTIMRSKKDKSYIIDEMYRYYDFYKKYFESKKPKFLGFLNEILNPSKNEFKLVNIGSNLPHYNEIWTDSNSIMISNDLYEYETKWKNQGTKLEDLTLGK